MFVMVDGGAMVDRGVPFVFVLSVLTQMCLGDFGGKLGVVTEFRQPLQVQSHLEMPRILVQLGHIQRTEKLDPQTDPKWSPTWSVTRYQSICPFSARDGRYACQVSRAQRTHIRP